MRYCTMRTKLEKLRWAPKKWRPKILFKREIEGNLSRTAIDRHFPRLKDKLQEFQAKREILKRSMKEMLAIQKMEMRVRCQSCDNKLMIVKAEYTGLVMNVSKAIRKWCCVELCDWERCKYTDFLAWVGFWPPPMGQMFSVLMLPSTKGKRIGPNSKCIWEYVTNTLWNVHNCYIAVIMEDAEIERPGAVCLEV